MTDVSSAPRLPGFEAAYRAASRRLFVERARFLLWSALVLYLAFGLLALAVAREQAGTFFLLRCAAAGIYVLALIAVYSRWAERLALPFVMAGALASAAGISLVAALLGGFTSNYFAGNIIVIFTIGVFLPWEPLVLAVLCGLIIATDQGINLAMQGASRELIGPLFFLLGSGVFTCLATVSSRRTRRRDLSLRLRLERANDELKELDEAKTRFFANVSHELRTPLTLLLGPLETLLSSEEEGERRTLLESMAASSRRLLRQVNALLDGAKLESGRLRLALARELARLHGGNVTVRSRLGEGSLFRVELPRDPAEAIVERRRKPRRREDQLAQARTDAHAAREYAVRSLRETLLADVELPPRRAVEGPRPQPPANAPRLLLVEDTAALRSFLAPPPARRDPAATAS